MNVFLYCALGFLLRKLAVYHWSRYSWGQRYFSVTNLLYFNNKHFCLLLNFTWRCFKETIEWRWRDNYLRMFVNDLDVVHHAEMVLCGGRPLAGLIIPAATESQEIISSNWASLHQVYIIHHTIGDLCLTPVQYMVMVPCYQYRRHQTVENSVLGCLIIQRK